MNLPELPSEEQVTKWLQSVLMEVGRYVRNIWRALYSPTSLVRYWMHGRSTSGTTPKTSVQITPFPFALLTLVLASFLERVTSEAFGVAKPFFEHLTYSAHLRAYSYWIKSLEQLLPVGFSATIVLSVLKFTIVLLIVVPWARLLTKSDSKYWDDIAALSYLLPLVLVVDMVEYCGINQSFRMIGDNVTMFVAAKFLISMLSPVIVYGIFLRVVDQVYYARGWRRVLLLTGSVILIPTLLFLLQVALYFVPIGYYAYRVITPTAEGESRLKNGDHEGAEKLFVQAIKNDVSGVWSARAHIRLISVNSKRILALLPDITVDSGIRERLLGHFLRTDPFKKVANVWRSEGEIRATPAQLVEFREVILHSFLTTGDIPVTFSELECALRPTAAEDGCDDLSKDAVTRYANTPAQNQQLYYSIFRARALRGEPTTADARRYLQFLFELPIRIEIQFVRYRALNLSRDSETLAYLDFQDRYEVLDRAHLINANREILNRGAKFPHLMLPDADIEKLSDQELGFHFRQAYLNYLRAEARLLAASPFSDLSSFIRQQTASIEEQLNWVTNDVIYQHIPVVNPLERAVNKLFDFKVAQGTPNQAMHPDGPSAHR